MVGASTQNELLRSVVSGPFRGDLVDGYPEDLVDLCRAEYGRTRELVGRFGMMSVEGLLPPFVLSEREGRGDVPQVIEVVGLNADVICESLRGGGFMFGADVLPVDRFQEDFTGEDQAISFWEVAQTYPGFWPDCVVDGAAESVNDVPIVVPGSAFAYYCIARAACACGNPFVSDDTYPHLEGDLSLVPLLDILDRNRELMNFGVLFCLYDPQFRAELSSFPELQGWEIAQFLRMYVELMDISARDGGSPVSASILDLGEIESDCVADVLRSGIMELYRRMLSQK